MAEDFDVEAMLEAPYNKSVSIYLHDRSYHLFSILKIILPFCDKLASNETKNASNKI